MLSEGGQFVADRRIRASESQSWVYEWQPSRDQKHRIFLDQCRRRFDDNLYSVVRA